MQAIHQVEEIEAEKEPLVLALEEIGGRLKVSVEQLGYEPEKPAYRYILGFIYSVKRQWGKAIAEFELAIAKDPDNGEYLRGLAWAIHSSGDKAKGLA